MSDDLTAFVTARLDEDEAIARRNIGSAPGSQNGLGDTGEFGPSWPDYQTFDGDQIAAANDYLDRFRPLRMLREVAAKRAIVALHAVEVKREQRRALAEDIADGKPLWWYEDECSCVLCGWFDADAGGCLIVRHLAAIWSDHPDYRPEWAPEGAPDGT